MHAKCPNCQSNLSCGCQKRTASNGTQCCTLCLAAYEQQLKKQSGGGSNATATILYPGPKK